MTCSRIRPSSVTRARAVFASVCQLLNVIACDHLSRGCTTTHPALHTNHSTYKETCSNIADALSPSVMSSEPVKPRSYRHCVTSALHTRFCHAALLTLLFNLAIACATSDFYSSIKSFVLAVLPVGPAGIKALLFWTSNLTIFLLQITYYRIGRRTTASNLESVRNAVLSLETYFTFFWYMLSGWVFGEVLIWVSPASAELGMVIKGGYGVPDKINEKGNYLRLFFVVLGAVRAGLHIYKDESALRLPTAKPVKPQDQAKSQPPKTVIGEVLQAGQDLATQIVAVSGLTAVASVVLYSTMFRPLLWHMQVFVAKTLYSISRTEAHPPSGFYIGTVIVRAFLCGILLLVSWQLNILLFNIYIVQEPSDKGVMLSTNSKDPNGTLINGLNAKDMFTRTFAFWELDIVARTQGERRQKMFFDIDRPTGPVVTSAVNAAVKVISAIDARIAAMGPPGSTTPQAAQEADENIQTLPRLLPQPAPTRSQVFAAPATGTETNDRIRAFVASGARTLGSSKQPWSPPMGVAKQKIMEYGSPIVRSADSRIEHVRTSPAARFLLPSPVRNINAAILGCPTGNAAITTYALSSVTTLLSTSLKEDVYGKAIGSVPNLVTQITATINAVESYVRHQLPNGTITKSEEEELKESVAVYTRLKSSLRELLSAFQMFLSDQGLSIVDLNEATRANKNKELFKVTPEQPRLENRKERPTGQQREMQQVQSRSGSSGKHEIEASKPRSQGSQKQILPHSDSRKPSNTASDDDDDDELSRAQRSRDSASEGSTKHPRSNSSTDREHDQDRRPGRLFKHLDRPQATAATRQDGGIHAMRNLQRQTSTTSYAAIGTDSDRGGGLSRRVTSQVGA